MSDNPTEKSLNRQIAEALGWRLIPDLRLDHRDSWRVIPDYEHDLNLTMAALRLRERQMQAMLRYNVHNQQTECMLLRWGGGLDTYFFTGYGDGADDLARAAARALLVLLRRERER